MLLLLFPPLSSTPPPCVRVPFSQVSSLRESLADERKLYVYSGTKRLDLRAETAEDRNAWMEALQVGAALHASDAQGGRF